MSVRAPSPQEYLRDPEIELYLDAIRAELDRRLDEDGCTITSDDIDSSRRQDGNVGYLEQVATEANIPVRLYDNDWLLELSQDWHGRKAQCQPVESMPPREYRIAKLSYPAGSMTISKTVQTCSDGSDTRQADGYRLTTDDNALMQDLRMTLVHESIASADIDTQPAMTAAEYAAIRGGLLINSQTGVWYEIACAIRDPGSIDMALEIRRRSGATPLSDEQAAATKDFITGRAVRISRSAMLADIGKEGEPSATQLERVAARLGLY